MLCPFLPRCQLTFTIFAWRLRSTVEVYQWEEQKSEKKSKDSIGHMAIGTYELLRVGSDYHMASEKCDFLRNQLRKCLNVPKFWGIIWGKVMYTQNRRSQLLVDMTGWNKSNIRSCSNRPFHWNDPIQWDGNKVFVLLLTNLLYQLDLNEMITWIFLNFLSRVAIFLTCFPKKSSMNLSNLNTPFQVSSTLRETHIAPEKWWLGNYFHFGARPISEVNLLLVSGRVLFWVNSTKLLNYKLWFPLASENRSS